MPVTTIFERETRVSPSGERLPPTSVLPYPDPAAAARSIQEASRPLAEELKKKPEPPPLFTTANRGPKVSPDFERIVETVYAVDAFKDYEDLEKNLEVGDDRGDYKTLTVHLDKAESRARRAHALYLGAKLELASWEAEADKLMASMRQKALDDLEEEKANGDRRKAITDADVRSKVAELYPDEFTHHEKRRAKIKGTAEHLERLADLWRQRCYSISTLLSNLRK